MLDLSRLSNLGEALSDATVMFKTLTALVEVDRHREKATFTYHELRQAARRFGAALQQREFAAGDRVAIAMSNQSKWLISATGAFWTGAVLVPIDYKLTAPEQASLLAHCRPKALVTEYSTWLKLASELRNAGLGGTVVFVTEAPEGADLAGAERWEDACMAVDGSALVEKSRRRDDVACIVYSSGTGGTPKGCQLTHGNYLAQAEVLGRMYPMTEGQSYFSILPTNHAIDFMCGFLVTLMMGARVVHQRTLRPQYLVDTMKRYEITHMALVPMILKSLKEKIKEGLDALPAWQKNVVDGLTSVNEMATKDKPRHTLSRSLLKPVHDKFGGHLQMMFCGGAFVDRDAAEYFYRLGLPVVIGYGLTEAGTVLTVNDLKPFRGDTVGKPVRGTELELRNKNDQGVGEVWVRGPTVMKGYLDAPELTAEAIVDGWLRTGDLGTLDASGHLKLVGRAKNMIVTEGGKNIYPEDIEAAFDGVKDVEEICAYAANYVWPTGKLTGETLMVVVRPKDSGKSADGGLATSVLDELRRRNRKLSDYKRVSEYVMWDKEFPRTASMKIKRDPLAKELAAEPRATLLQELGE